MEVIAGFHALAAGTPLLGASLKQAPMAQCYSDVHREALFAPMSDLMNQNDALNSRGTIGAPGHRG